ncbi:MAG: hypothetical protein H0A76_12220 [Candidatus Thiodubiliella endoseptemdiera]|uniref:Uncharacterized protein n=1 Tax=Candidatus Thiodubiliella endoseptemdiera TaxID=2738886 RepID=A0A853F4V5_9GAMM|nr:hypothetical protein [Candidatus Thiodubiliella endoseptemdiera]
MSNKIVFKNLVATGNSSEDSIVVKPAKSGVRKILKAVFLRSLQIWLDKLQKLERLFLHNKVVLINSINASFSRRFLIILKRKRL